MFYEIYMNYMYIYYLCSSIGIYERRAFRYMKEETRPEMEVGFK